MIKVLDKWFHSFGFICTMIGLFVLGVLLWDVASDGLVRINWDFLMSYPSRKPQEAGILSSWVGTVWIMFTTAMLAVPLGIGCGIYLEEYAKKSWFTDLIEINIANLAGVPSIIYGLLGLGIFVRYMHLDRSVLAGGMTLALLILPVIILSTREALRAVPYSIREASLGLGATKWQTVYFQVLPMAFGNIMTGIILSLSRAIGETAPLITIGALTYIPFLPTSPISFSSQFPFVQITFKGLWEAFTVMPIQIFNWVSRPQKGFIACAAAAIVVLLLITLCMNAIAIFLRHKHQKRY